MTTPDQQPPLEPLTPEEKEAFLARARSEGRSLTSAEQYAIFGPPPDKVESFRSAELVDEMEPAPLDAAQIERLSADFFADLPGTSAGAPRLLRGVIFDFDDTLATLNRPLDELMHRGAQDAVAYMRSTGMDLPDDFAQNIVEARLFAQEKSDEESEEHLADDALSFLLQFFGFPASRMDPDVLRRAVDIFYAHEMTAWQLRPGALDLLRSLQVEGFKLALLTNYNADRVFQRTVDYLGLRPFLDICLTSAAVEYRKPDPRFFQIVLDRWDALAYEVVAVGDSLKQDVAGALETGCLSILCEPEPGAPRAEPQVAHDNERLASQIKADAVVTNLAEILPLVQEWATP